MLKSLAESEFVRRTNGGFRTPVYREFLADRETPVAILIRRPSATRTRWNKPDEIGHGLRCVIFFGERPLDGRAAKVIYSAPFS